MNKKYLLFIPVYLVIIIFFYFLFFLLSQNNLIGSVTILLVLLIVSSHVAYQLFFKHYLKITPRWFTFLGLVCVSIFIIVAISQIISKLPANNSESSKNTNKISDISTSPSPTIFPVTDYPGTVSWLSTPKKIAKLDVFAVLTNNSDYTEENISQAEFYLVGTLSDGAKLIHLHVPTDNMDGSTDFYLLQSPDNQITFVDQSTDGSLWSSNKSSFTSEITLNPFKFKELEPPEKLTFNYNQKNIVLVKGYSLMQTFDSLVNPKLIQSTDFGNVYVVYFANKTNPQMYYVSYYLKLKDSSVYNYIENYPFLSDDEKVTLDWLDNSQVDSQFSNKTSSGCGSPTDISVIKDSSTYFNFKIQVATYNQQPIYQMNGSDNSYLQQFYKEYQSTAAYKPTGTPILSYEEFLKAKNNFIYQNFLGDWVIFINQDYVAAAECGKPVVYLYPTKDTLTTIKVGANITKSEPLYSANGWTVLAHPNGQLDYQGQTYPNLFWEGTGLGAYNSHSGEGFVVSQKDLLPTLKKQLQQQGLTDSESADFLAFWSSKLPQTPYVRLTWLNTGDMNTLAPLTVFPRPQTAIRVFLDFAGLDKPINLLPQKLSAPQRQGFTLVEWGGLLVK
jgi:hypothetical protein